MIELSQPNANQDSVPDCIFNVCVCVCRKMFVFGVHSQLIFYHSFCLYNAFCMWSVPSLTFFFYNVFSSCQWNISFGTLDRHACVSANRPTADHKLYEDRYLCSIYITILVFETPGFPCQWGKSSHHRRNCGGVLSCVALICFPKFSIRWQWNFLMVFTISVWQDFSIHWSSDVWSLWAKYFATCWPLGAAMDKGDQEAGLLTSWKERFSHCTVLLPDSWCATLLMALLGHTYQSM